MIYSEKAVWVGFNIFLKGTIVSFPTVERFVKDSLLYNSKFK